MKRALGVRDRDRGVRRKPTYGLLGRLGIPGGHASHSFSNSAGSSAVISVVTLSSAVVRG